MVGKAGHRGFGNIRQRSSGRYQASYVGLDGARHAATRTFDTKAQAESWLAGEYRRMQDAETWRPPKVRIAEEAAAKKAAQLPTFNEYAEQWITDRRVKGKPLAPRTRDQYLGNLVAYLSPTFGDMPLDEITPQAVNVWFDAFKPTTAKKHGRKVNGDTARARTYGFARAVMNTAVSAHGPLVGRVNPFAVRGGGSAPTKRRDEQVATGQQLDVILATIKPKWRALILFGVWTGMRYSEIVELRRGDVDIEKRIVKVRRSVTRSKIEGVGVKGPKSDAGLRDVNIPSHVLPAIQGHLDTYVAARSDAMLFPNEAGEHLAPATFYGGLTKYKRDDDGKKVKVRTATPGGWYDARTKAGIPDFHFHDLRATGATLMAQLGATEAEIMAFLGDSTPQAAQRYVRAARSRMVSLADKMSELAAAGAW